MELSHIYLAVIDMEDVGKKILWKNYHYIVLRTCRAYCAVEMIVNVIVHFHIEIGNFIILS